MSRRLAVAWYRVTHGALWVHQIPARLLGIRRETRGYLWLNRLAYCAHLRLARETGQAR